MQRKPNSF
jgi:hypothetical protein